MLGSIGLQEMLIVGLIILLLFGARKIPALARGLGQSLGEFSLGRQESQRNLAATTQTKP